MEKMTLVDRSLATLSAYLQGDLGKHFYSNTFLDRISERRNEIYARQGKSVAQCFFLTTILAFFDSLSGQKFTLQGLELTVSPVLSSPLALLVSGSLFASVLAALDQIIIDRYIDKIGNSAGLWSFKVYLVDRSAVNLWSEPLMPKYFGPMSTGSVRVLRRGLNPSG